MSPYRPIDAKDWPDWAPAEGTLEVCACLPDLQQRVAQWLEGKG